MGVVTMRFLGAFSMRVFCICILFLCLNGSTNELHEEDQIPNIEFSMPPIRWKTFRRYPPRFAPSLRGSRTVRLSRSAERDIKGHPPRKQRKAMLYVPTEKGFEKGLEPIGVPFTYRHQEKFFKRKFKRNWMENWPS